ncbi:MICAL-like protein 1 isoform X2 [Anopheles albimanus]|uniref:MICAL-like protein 1 isoform X2 n=1 Tax=Anopheles albimanus TaxID=7167 RepID=UPI001641844B|nr:MICAL-like protein 1 isoform X2 [Anopheles albimanus]
MVVYDFASLSKDNVYYNNELAFTIAEQHLGIPSLLDPADMVKYEVPDRFSILTYLSQYYRVFSNQEPATSKKASDKDTKTDDLSSKMANIPGFVGVPKRATCNRCSNPIFLAERISFGAKSYHRSCLKCARCGTQLTVGSFYETETDGEYCCETCPDEEIQLEIKRRKSSVSSSSDGGSRGSSVAAGVPNVTTALPRAARSSKLLDRISFFESAPLSDEEKSSNLERKAKMSSFLKGTLEEANQKQPDATVTMPSEQSVKTIETVEIAQPDDEDPPNLPKTAPPPIPGDVADAPNAEAESITEPSTTIEAIVPEESESIEDQFDKIVQDLEGGGGEEKELVVEGKSLPQITPIAESAGLSKGTDDDPFESPTLELKEEGNEPSSKREEEVHESEIKIVIDNIDEEEHKEEENKNTPSKKGTGAESEAVQEQSKVLSEEQSNVEAQDEIVVEPVIVERDAVQKDPLAIPSPSIPVIETSTESDALSNVPDEKESTEPELISSKEEPETELEREIKVPTEQKDPEDESNDRGQERKSSETLKIEEQMQHPDVPNNQEQSNVKDTPTAGAKTEPEAGGNVTKSEELYPSDLNPFGDEEDEGEGIVDLRPKAPAKKPTPTMRRVSTNPFGSEDEDDDAEQHQSPSAKPPRPPPPKVKGTTAVPANPFDEDDETVEEEAEIVPIVSKPSPRRTPVPTPRKPGHAYNDSISSLDNSLMSSSRLSSSNVSLASSLDSGPPSMTVQRRKKSKAPDIPVPLLNRTPGTGSSSPSLASSSGRPSIESSSISATPLSSIGSTGTLTTPRKKRAPAPPPPPTSSSTPKQEDTIVKAPSNQRLVALDTGLMLGPNDQPESSDALSRATSNESVVYRRMIVPLPMDNDASPEAPLNDSETSATSERQWEKMKDNKEAQNRNRQSLSSPNGEGNGFSAGLSVLANKSSQGKWKRRKGPAPALPIAPLPERKPIKMLPLKEIHQELQIIETQQQGLEKQGIVLEKMIRERCEGVEADIDLDIRLQANSKEVEDLIMQLFELVNEKNELFRRQAELMYLRRMHRLEQEQADLEYEIRLLMAQPERNKPDSDKEKEEALIARLVEIVQLRNEVVECLEMDRIREAEEDLSIKQSIEERAASQQSKHSKKDSSASSTILPLTDAEKQDSSVKLSKKEKKKLKEAKKLVKSKKIDSEKDADETEAGVAKEKKKKRKFLF